MKYISHTFAVLLIFFLICSFSVAEQSRHKAYQKIGKFEKEVIAYEKTDLEKKPDDGAIVVTGSSSIRMWQNRIHQDLAPLTIIARGFGGSNMNELDHYAERLILKHKPRAVVIYEGDNDVAQNVSLKDILAKFHNLKNKIFKMNPQARIYYISVKPSFKRVKLWPKAVELNKAVYELCKTHNQLFYIDTANALLKDGQLQKKSFIKDLLHLSNEGYDIWAKVVKNSLLKHELKHEQIKKN